MFKIDFLIDIDMIKFVYAISFLIIGTVAIFLATRKQAKEKKNYILFSLWSLFFGLNETLLYFIEGENKFIMFLSELFIFLFCFFLFWLIVENLFISRYNFNFSLIKLVFLKFLLLSSLFFLFFLFKQFLFAFLGIFFILVALHFLSKYKNATLSLSTKKYYLIIFYLFFFYGFLILFEGLILDNFFTEFVIYSLFLRAGVLFLVCFQAIHLYIEDVSIGKTPKYYEISKRFVVFSFIIFLIILYFFNNHILNTKNEYYAELETYKNSELENIIEYFNHHNAHLNTLSRSFASNNERLKNFLVEYYSASSTEDFYIDFSLEINNSLYKTMNSFRVATGMEALYIMDDEGRVVLSSNKDGSDSFLGKNYDFMTYFQKAIKGEDNVYFARSMDSNKKEAYYSSPVFFSGSSSPRAVVVVKMNEKVFDNFFLGRDNAFLLSPENVIFATSRDELADKYLFENKDKNLPNYNECIYDEEVFGNLNLRKIDNNICYSPLEKYMFLIIKEINIPGWKIGFLENYEYIDSKIKEIVSIYLLIIFAYMLGFYFVISYFLHALFTQITESNYKDIFNNSNDLIFTLDVNDNIIFYNPAFERIFSDKIKKTKVKITDILNKKSYKEYKKIVKKIDNKASVRDLEMIFVDKNGNKICLKGGFSKIDVDSKNYIIRAIFRDISSEKEWNEKIEKANKNLEELLSDAETEKENKEAQRLATLNILEDVSETQERMEEYNKDLEKKSGELESLAMLSSEFANVFEIEKLILKIKNYLIKNIDAELITFFVNSDYSKQNLFYKSYIKTKVTNDFVNQANKRTNEYILNSVDNFSLKASSVETLKNDVFGKISEKETSKIESDLFLDLKIGKKSFGFVYFCSNKKNVYQKDSMSYLKTISASFSVALANAQLLNKTQQSKTESLVKTLSNGIIMFNNEARVVLTNPAGERFSGISKEKNSLILFYEKTKKYKIKENVEKALKNGIITKISELEIKLNNKDYIFQVLIIPVTDFNKKIIGAAMTMQDITHLKYIDKMKTEFVSVASHQLRTPLTAIKLFTEMLINEQVGKISKQQKMYLSNVYDSTERMVALVNDLLNVSRIESGHLMINPELIDINKFLSSLISEAIPLAEIKKIKINFDFKKKLSLIPLDRSLVRQVYHNLLTNAIRYSREGGVVKVNVKLDKNNFIVSVNDAGIGIPKEVQGRIFEKFFRADNAVKIATEGTGLGLYVSKMIIESSGGKIWFESKKGKGATFFVSLPKKGMKKKGEERGLSIS